MLRHFKIWLRCPEIRFQITQYWLLFLASVLTMAIFSPVILLAFVLSLLGTALEWIGEKIFNPYNKIIVSLENRRRDTIQHAHSVIDVEKIQKRLKDDSDT